MKIHLSYLFILAICSTYAQASDVSARKIAVTELAIHNVSIGDTERSVLAKLGPPKSKNSSGKGIDYVYGDIELLVAFTAGPNRRVYGLMSFSPKYCMPSKICPKQSLKNAINTLGETRTLDIDKSSMTTYIVDRPGCKIRLVSEKSIIKYIGIGCDE